jgi:hypothetical protein
MANTFKLKRSSVAAKGPTTGDLQLGELALNTYDGKLYTKKDNGTATIVEIGAAGGGGGTTFTYSSSAPGSPTAGNEWLDSTSGILYTYVNDGNSLAWVELGPFGITGPSVTIGTSAADVLSIAAGELTADDAAADKIVFWDDSAGKLTYLTIGSNLTVTDTTIAASGGGGTTFTYTSSAPGSPSAGDEWLDSTSGILYTYVNDGNSSAWVELGPFGAQSISPVIAGMIF